MIIKIMAVILFQNYLLTIKKCKQILWKDTACAISRLYRNLDEIWKYDLLKKLNVFLRIDRQINDSIKLFSDKKIRKIANTINEIQSSVQADDALKRLDDIITK